MIVRKALTLPTMEYYATHLSIINAVIPHKFRITPREIEVLACLLTLPDSTRFTSTGRKQVMDMLALSKSSMSNHMRALIAKRFVTTSPDDDGTPIDVAPNIMPTPTQEYHIKITHDASLPDIAPMPIQEDEPEDIDNSTHIYNGRHNTHQIEREEEEKQAANY